MTDFEEYDFFGIKRDGRPPKRHATRPVVRRGTLEQIEERFADSRPECLAGSPYWSKDFFEVTGSSRYREAAVDFAKKHGFSCFEVYPIQRGWIFARTPRAAADLLAENLHLVQL